MADFGVLWNPMMLPLSPAANAWPQVAPHQLDAFFASTELSDPKDEICDIGRRLWQRAYVDGNGGSSQPNVIPAPRLRELLTTKQTLGMPDARRRVGSRPALPAAYHRGRVWELLPGFPSK